MTLRARVLAGLALIAVVSGLVALVVPRLVEDHLVDQIDDELASTDFPIRIDPGPPPGADDEGPDRPSRIFVALVESDGSVTRVFLPNYGDAAVPDLDADAVVARAGAGPYTVDAGDTRYRMVATPAGDLVVVVGLPLDDVDDAVARLVRIQVIALAVVLVALALVAWWVIRLGVRPVNEMAAAATEIGAGDLSARVPEYPEATEAGRLGVALNRMLARIEEAFEQRRRSEERLRRFAADASHELRTPVTTVRGYAELYRSGALDDPDELAEAMRRVEQESVRMGSLVDDLLRLARLDQGRELERRPVDLAALVTEAGQDAQATDRQRPVAVEVDGPVVVEGDEALLRQVVVNLVANALVHTEPDVAVTLRAALVDGGAAVVEVHDDGPGMAPEVAERVFERFYRADSSRSRHTGGSGLGLAIAKAAVTAHGGEITLDTAPGQGTTFRMRLPVAG